MCYFLELPIINQSPFNNSLWSRLPAMSKQVRMQNENKSELNNKAIFNKIFSSKFKNEG